MTSGYAGGTPDSPSYEEVCTGSTGYAEVVRVAFDPDRTTYAKNIDLYWKIHNPTSLNRQGAERNPVPLGHLLRRRRAGEGGPSLDGRPGRRYDRPLVTQLLPGRGSGRPRTTTKVIPRPIRMGAIAEG